MSPKPLSLNKTLATPPPREALCGKPDPVTGKNTTPRGVRRVKVGHPHPSPSQWRLLLTAETRNKSSPQLMIQPSLRPPPPSPLASLMLARRDPGSRLCRPPLPHAFTLNSHAMPLIILLSTWANTGPHERCPDALQHCGEGRGEGSGTNPTAAGPTRRAWETAQLAATKFVTGEEC